MTEILKSQYDQNLTAVLAAGAQLGAHDIAARVAQRGGSVRDVYREYLERTAVPDPDRMLGLTPADTSNYSLLSLVRAQADGEPNTARHERDLSSLVASKTGKVPNGEYVPFSVLAQARDFNVGTASEAGNLLGAARLGDLAGDPLRKVFTLGRLGATFFSGLKATAGVPVFDSSTAASYLTETGSAVSVLETTRLVTLTPRRVTVVFIMSRQAVIQSTPEMEAAAKRQMATAIDEAMQYGVLAGNGSGNNPTGILLDSSVNIEVGDTDGATLTFQHLVNMEYAAANANVDKAATGWVINPATAKYLRTKPRASGLPEIFGNDNLILGAPVAITNTMPADLTKGAGTALSGLIYSPNWSDLLIGIYGGGIDVMVDRVTLADQGKLRVVCALEFGFGLRYPAAFSVMKDAKLV